MCLYVYEEQWLRAEDTSRRHLLFLNQCLQELEIELENRGQRLLRFRGTLPDLLHQIHHRHPINGLVSHEETGNGLTYARDRRVKGWCRYHSVPWREVAHHGVIRRLHSRNGWAALWARRMGSPVLPVPESLPAPPALHQLPASIRELSPEEAGLFPDGENELQKGGRSVGLHTLDSFLQSRGQDYTRAMSSPVTAFDACSRCSPYFTYGAISIREAYQAGRRARDSLTEQDLPKGDIRLWRSAYRSFLGRLRWHCHFMQKLEDQPDLEFRNLFRPCDGLREQSWNQEWFEAWKEGRTGYPLVDASMRALRATGWINFRMRAMLMSFASYHLWLHWRPTGLQLARWFTDYEPGIHWSQTQMQSGTTGINSIRIYSPSKQVKDQDPTGIFIRKWVPELNNLPDAALPEPWKLPELEQKMVGCQIGIDYPKPIVDHASAYRSAQERIRSVRRGDPARQEKQKIYQKHGSRRRPHLSTHSRKRASLTQKTDG